LVLWWPRPAASEGAAESARPSPKRAQFAREKPSRDARRLADWIVDSGDHRNLPFVIVDKPNAKVYVFGAGGYVRGSAAALLGLALGDHTVPGIGERELRDMSLEERTTPAGRFIAGLGMNFRGEDVLWVDHESGLSLHRVLTTKPEERRLERLASVTVKDNRISYGCINVPKSFYEKVVSPTFTGTEGIVYILPDSGPAREVFNDAYHTDATAVGQPLTTTSRGR
ncbi:MAG: hypothetical protein ACREVG_18960, partial [Burkholderiales bacterium]